MSETPLLLRFAPLLAAGSVLAGCTPPEYPDNPFKIEEQNMKAPATVPLDTGFPGAEDLAAARETEMAAFGLSEDAEALAARSKALAERDPERSDAQIPPPMPLPELEARQKSLRERAAELRARPNGDLPETSPEIDAQREDLGSRADALRNRKD